MPSVVTGCWVMCSGCFLLTSVGNKSTVLPFLFTFLFFSALLLNQEGLGKSAACHLITAFTTINTFPGRIKKRTKKDTSNWPLRYRGGSGSGGMASSSNVLKKKHEQSISLSSRSHNNCVWLIGSRFSPWEEACGLIQDLHQRLFSRNESETTRTAEETPSEHASPPRAAFSHL